MRARRGMECIPERAHRPGATSIRSSPPLPLVSIVIPVFEEEERLPDQLRALSTLRDLHEVIVVDGRSRDRTVERARSFPDVRIVEAPRGRASQMNADANLATGDTLLFLHADVRLPPDALRWVAWALADPEVIAGAFRTWTVCDRGRTWLSPLLHLADLRSLYTALPYGDQAIFVRAGIFQQLGGFPALPLMEDLELSRRLRRVGMIRTVPARVRVSGRRFEAGPLYYAAIVNLLPLLYRLGVPARFLAGLYGDPR